MLLPLLFVSGVLGKTNTNQCIWNMDATKKCSTALGSPHGGSAGDLARCCDGLYAMLKEGCDFNPLMSQILGPAASDIFAMEGLCRITQNAAEWDKIPNKKDRRQSFKPTFDYGCEQNDMEMDALRYANVVLFDSAFFLTNFTDKNNCYDTPALEEFLLMSIVEEGSISGPYGLGTYAGIQNVAEYTSMLNPIMNHGFLKMDPPDPTKRSRLDVSEDGLSWVFGNTNSGSFLQGSFEFKDYYTEMIVSFEKCQTKISNALMVPLDDFRNLAEFFVRAAFSSKRYGIEDMCRYHTKYCQGTKWSQYKDEAECLSYIKALPIFSEKCGPNRPLGGHSIGCRFKHHFMVSGHPSLHCGHIGKHGALDVNGNLKCNDKECTADHGQDAWPALRNIGKDITAEQLAPFTSNDIGVESDKPPCALELPTRAKSGKPKPKVPPIKQKSLPTGLKPVTAVPVVSSCNKAMTAASACLQSNLQSLDCKLSCLSAMSGLAGKVECNSVGPRAHCENMNCCPHCENEMKALFNCQLDAKGCKYNCDNLPAPTAEPTAATPTNEPTMKVNPVVLSGQEGWLSANSKYASAMLVGALVTMPIYMMVANSQAQAMYGKKK